MYRVIVFIVITTCLEFQLEIVPLRRKGWKTSSPCDPCNCGDDLVDPEMLNLADRRLASAKDLIEYGKRDFCTLSHSYGPLSRFSQGMEQEPPWNQGLAIGDRPR